MTKGDNICFKYIKVPADNISSWCTSSRRTVFNWRAEIEHRKVSEIPSSDSKTDSFQKGRAVFQTAVNLDKEQCIKDYIIEVIIIRVANKVPRTLSFSKLKNFLTRLLCDTFPWKKLIKRVLFLTVELNSYRYYWTCFAVIAVITVVVTVDDVYCFTVTI
jgi:hypothetical protein